MFEHIITDRANENQHSLVYEEGKISFTYRQMAEDIARCCGWLKARGIKPGDRVALHLTSVYRHWVLFFALEATRAISVAISNIAPLTSSRMIFLGANFYITDQKPNDDLKIRGEVLDRGWFVRVRKFRPLLPSALQRSDEDAVCIVLSSGTTGAPKKVLLTRSIIDIRVMHERSSDLINSTSRVLVRLPNDSIGGFLTVLSTMAVGGTICVLPKDMTAERAIMLLEPTVIAGAPSHFSELLSSLSENFIPKRSIDAASGGGALAAPIAAAIQQKLRGQIKQSYASTEMGFVARGDFKISQEHKGSVGFVLPFVQVSITDHTGNPLPHGEIGEIWVRGAHVVNGYAEDSHQTAISFRDGWYHPGDIGTLQSNGLLAVHGRTDDLMNYRGAKLLPAPIEEKILRSGVVSDVAVFLANKPGSSEPQLWIACVSKMSFDPLSLSAFVPKKMPHVITLVAGIPRNAMGKVERSSLRAKAELGELSILLV